MAEKLLFFQDWFIIYYDLLFIERRKQVLFQTFQTFPNNNNAIIRFILLGIVINDYIRFAFGFLLCYQFCVYCCFIIPINVDMSFCFSNCRIFIVRGAE